MPFFRANEMVALSYTEEINIGYNYDDLYGLNRRYYQYVYPYNEYWNIRDKKCPLINNRNTCYLYFDDTHGLYDDMSYRTFDDRKTLGEGTIIRNFFKPLIVGRRYVFYISCIVSDRYTIDDIVSELDIKLMDGNGNIVYDIGANLTTDSSSSKRKQFLYEPTSPSLIVVAKIKTHKIAPPFSQGQGNIYLTNILIAEQFSNT